MFNKGFEAITKSLGDQLGKMVIEATKLGENTAYMRKILDSNKDIKKQTENLSLVIDGLMARLDKVAQKLNIM